MRLILNTKDKSIVFEEPLTINEMRETLEILAPGWSTFDKFTVSTGPVSVAKITKIAKPLTRDYNYSPAFDWLEYVKGTEVVTDDKVATPTYPTLKEGTWNIEIN